MSLRGMVCACALIVLLVGLALGLGGCSGVAALMSPFAGHWSGTFEGDYSGTWSASVSGSGFITFSATFAGGGTQSNSNPLTSSVGNDGDWIVRSNGTIGSQSAEVNWPGTAAWSSGASVSGTWTVMSGPTGHGTFTGTRTGD
jgi:hypothetical protein